jgi:hypothetical protein
MVDENIILFRHRRARAFVFALDGGQNRLHARRHPAIEITVMEPRRNLFINNLFPSRIGQDAFQPITHFQKHGAVLDENEKHSAIVFILLPHFPCARHADGVILNGRIRLHLRVNDNEDLVGTLPLKIFQRSV